MNNFEEYPNLCSCCGDMGVYSEDGGEYVCKCKAGADYWLQKQLDREMERELKEMKA